MSRFSVVILCVLFFLPSVVQTQEPTVDDVVGKHLSSVGTKESLSAVKNQLLLGNVEFKLKGSATILNGKALILSSSGKTLWGMNFASNDYPQDRFAFDGNQVKVGFSTPSRRSLLAQFLNDYRDLLKEGILGGTLSNSWPLLNLSGKAKMKTEGRKKVDGKEMIVLEYMPKGGSDLTIKLYFDPTDYRHLRSEHTVIRAATQGTTIDNSAGQTGRIFKLVEEFSDFKKVKGLTLPLTYKITYSASGAREISTIGNTNRDAEWTFKFTDFSMNQELNGNSFSIEN